MKVAQALTIKIASDRVALRGEVRRNTSTSTSTSSA
jgi:hypothetical protein